MKKDVSMNKMGIVPVKKLMLGMGVPMILSMMLQALYNIVDSYFVSCIPGTALVSNMGDLAVNALTLAFLIQMLMVAIGVGTGVGVNTLLARSIGQGNKEKANQVAGNAIFLALCTYIVFLIFGIFGVKGYINSQTSDVLIREMATSYLGVCCIISFGSIISMVTEKLLQSTGKTILSTASQIGGALTNLILDPILIFGLAGFPAMGIKGAAYATVAGQIVSCILGLIFHCTLNKEINAKLTYIKPRKNVIKEIYQIGIPAILMQAMMSVMTYGINIIFGTFSMAAVTAYGVYYKIQQFIFFASFGMNNAIIPIVSFNYGKRDKARVKDGVKYGLIFTLIIMFVGAIVLQLFAPALVGIFALSDETRELCISAIRIITLGYLFVGVNIASQGIFQAFGKGMNSLLLSLVRLIIVTLPLAYVFTKLPNASSMIWWAFPIAEGCAFVLALSLMKKVTKEQIETLPTCDENKFATAL